MSMVCNSLQIWVLIQDIVIDVQEKLEGVLVQEMYLKEKRVYFFSLESCCLITYQTAILGSASLALTSKHSNFLIGRTQPTCFSDSIVK